MPQEAESGKQFARDMRRIREAHHLTVGDLHDETKIPQTLIQAFEETGLFDHPQFNRVYLRSFVRTYANVVGVDAEEALDALEDALAGSYAGSLAASYLEDEPEEVPAEETEPSEEETAAEAQDTDEPPRKPAEQETEEREPPIVSTTSEAAASYEETGPEEEEEDEDVDEDWAAQSPPSAKPTGAGAAATSAAAGSAAAGSRAESKGTGTSRRREDRDAGGMDRRWILAGGMIIIVAVVVWILISVLGDSQPQANEPVAAADTAQARDTTQVQESAAQPVNIPAVGDTMDVRIIAAQGKVDPIRVTVDGDLRRPYWIEQGDSMAFDPTNRIVIEELLDNINLKIEGIEYPTSRRDPQGRIVITRDTLQSFFASLQGEQ